MADAVDDAARDLLPRSALVDDDAAVGRRVHFLHHRLAFLHHHFTHLRHVRAVREIDTEALRDGTTVGSFFSTPARLFDG